MGSARLPALARFRSSDHLKGKGSIGVGGNSRVGANDDHDLNAAVGSVGRRGDRRGGGESSLSCHADQVRDIVEEATGVSTALELYDIVLGWRRYVQDLAYPLRSGLVPRNVVRETGHEEGHKEPSLVSCDGACLPSSRGAEYSSC